MIISVDTYNDTDHKRMASMWAECGIQFRSNLLRVGGTIPLHAHHYDHVALITYGWFAVREITTTGEVREFQMASRGYQTPDENFAPMGARTIIPAGFRHEFRLIEAKDG